MDINHDSGNCCYYYYYIIKLFLTPTKCLVPIPTYQTIPHYTYEVTVVNAAGAEVVPNHLFDGKLKFDWNYAINIFVCCEKFSSSVAN